MNVTHPSYEMAKRLGIRSLLSALVFVLPLLSCGGTSETISTPSVDLLTAIDNENGTIVKQHIDAGTNINNYPIPEGRPFAGAQPMHLAVLKGNAGIVKMLLENGAQIDIKAKNSDEATPLHWAAFFGKKDMVSLLIESGAPINALDAHEHTSLDSAFFAWMLSQDDEAKAHLEAVMATIKNNGGESAKDL